MKLFSSLLVSGIAAASAFAPAPFGARSRTALDVAVGDSLPAIDLHINFPPDMVNLADRSKGKSILIIGLPGAFTPT